MKFNKRLLQGPLLYIALIAIALAMAQMFGSVTQDKIEAVTYTELLDAIAKDKISHIMTSGTTLVARTVDSAIPEKDFPRRYDWTSTLITADQFYRSVNAIYAARLNKSVDEISVTDYRFDVVVQPPAQPPWWVDWLPLVVTMLLFAAFWYFMMRQQSGGGKGVMNFGRSRARLTDPEKNKVTFADIAGADEEKDELREVVEFLRNPKRFIDMGARIPKGILLVGPPGTGKTLLARAVAGEAGVSFYTISGSDFVEMFVGVGASRVRDLFEQAKKAPPAIVFIDEIDAVGRQRGAGLGGGHDEREQTLNQLLVEMDGFAQNESIIIMAATNRSDILDPALLRPGRFDRQITVGYPDVKGREDILGIHSKGKPLAESVDLSIIAKRTPFFTGADLANVMNESAILAARAGQEKIDMYILEEAVNRVSMGPEKRSHKVTDKDKKLVAYHEAGHAIVMYATNNNLMVHEISIVRRGQAAGFNTFLPEEERSHTSSSQLKAQLAGMLGGHCAESMILGDVSTGSSSDLKRATSIARSMITEWGMSSEIGPVYFGTEHEVFLGRDFSQGSTISEKITSLIDSEVTRLLNDAYSTAHDLLAENIDSLHSVAKVLLEQEKIGREEFYAIMKGESLPEKTDPVKDMTEPKLIEESAELEPADEGASDEIIDQI